MGLTGSNIISTITNSNFPAEMVIMVYFTVIVITIERMIYLQNPRLNRKARMDREKEFQRIEK